MSTAFVHVVVGVLRDAQQRVLMAQRRPGKHLAGMWEFPGGKVEPGEQRFAALRRELYEELGVTVIAAQPLISVRHHYPDNSVWLDVWEVTQFSGTPYSREAQPLQWLKIENLSGLDLPQADIPIVTALRLSDCYVVTPEPSEPESFLADVTHALKQGAKLLQLRAKHYPELAWRELARRAIVLIHQHDAQALFNGPLSWVTELNADGVHFTAEQLLRTRVRPQLNNKWLAASCHNVDELAHAARIAVDFVVLSPVSATSSHPEATPLGWDGFSQLMGNVNMPCYALGGVGPGDIAQARLCGARGVAGISAFRR